MVFEEFAVFDHIVLRPEFLCMDGKNRPDLRTLYHNLRNTPGRSRVEKLVACEEPSWDLLFRSFVSVAGTRKDERPDTILVDSELFSKDPPFNFSGF